MDSAALGIAWGRRLSSHRRTRSGEPSNTAPPIEFTSDGTRYTLASEASLSDISTSQHVRSKSWSTSKEKNQTPKPPIFHPADLPNYKLTLGSPSPLHLHRAATSSKRSHRSNNSISSISTRYTSSHGSSSSAELLRGQFPTIPPQRPPRPPRGLFEDESDEEPADFMLVDHASEDSIQGLILESDQAFVDVDMALADAAYSTQVTQTSTGVNRKHSVRRSRLAAPTTARRSSIHSNRSARRNSIQSTPSNSTKGHNPRPPTTKKMGKRNVLLPRKLRLTLSQGVSELLASRAPKRESAASSLSSVYSDYLEDQPSIKRNSSITAAKRQSALQAKRHSADSKFALCATDGEHLTASQMYHREMLPNSVMAWMGTDSVFAEPDEVDEADEADDEELSHEFENKCKLVAEPDFTQPPATVASPGDAAEACPPPVEGSSPPPPPPKNPARFGARARTSQLAPIPEMLAASAAEGGERRRRGSSLTNISPKSKRAGSKPRTAAAHDSLYLVGTAYSKASPLFRHGHIEFQHKSPKARADDDGEEEECAADDHVDWAAFHSSILFDAGDLDSGMAQDEANAMADELGDWFEEFGFESHGALINSGRSREDGSSSSRSMASSRSSAASSTSTISDADLPMPASPEQAPFAKMQAWSFGQAERGAASVVVGRDEHSSDPIPVVTEMELGLDTYSLPPGEEPLRKQGPSRGPRMSCNLSEDLGQFLAWNPTHFDDMTEEAE
ncbi:hypothetical protein V2A60_003198 [Cordyceps javanica]|uniref:Uncharacterized protein n=1 Tax=Cordyceps javanica TaxID=43265 RepID=A0A545W190_9HYPO|nr:hypothetical protein IF1G_04974 [Cordyceps javanica]TQW07686.1 hypothetical protein IF2G_04847 [Cordyceps javanica]